MACSSIATTTTTTTTIGIASTSTSSNTNPTIFNIVHSAQTYWRRRRRTCCSHLKGGGGGGSVERRAARRARYSAQKTKIEQAKSQRQARKKQMRYEKRQRRKLRKQHPDRNGSQVATANDADSDTGNKIGMEEIVSGSFGGTPTHNGRPESNTTSKTGEDTPVLNVPRMKGIKRKNSRKPQVDRELNEIGDFIAQRSCTQQGLWLRAKLERTNVTSSRKGGARLKPLSSIAEQALDSGSGVAKLPLPSRKDLRKQKLRLAEKLRSLIKDEWASKLIISRNYHKRKSKKNNATWPTVNLTLNVRGMAGNEIEQEDQAGSFPLLIVTGSIARAAELCREFQKTAKGHQFVARLSAKSSDPEDQAKFVKINPVITGIGTPNRIRKLVEAGSLSLRELRIVGIDLWRDKKKKNMLDIPETAQDFWDLFVSHISPLLCSGRMQDQIVPETHDTQGYNQSVVATTSPNVKIVLLGENTVGYTRELKTENADQALPGFFIPKFKRNNSRATSAAAGTQDVTSPFMTSQARRILETS